MNTLRERNIERFNKSINGDKTDAHAVFNFLTYPFFQNESNISLNEYFNKPSTMAQTQYDVLKKIEFCGNIMPDFGVVAESSALGGVVKFDNKGFISIHPAQINDIDDIKKIKPGNPYENNYMCKAIEHLDYMVNNCPNELEVDPHPIMGAFTIAAQVRGISDFCADIIDEPEMSQTLINLAVQTQINFIKAQQKIMGESMKHILICDDLSAFLSPAQFEEFVLPAYEKLFDEFPNLQHFLHNDAMANHLMKSISTMNIKTWHYGTELTPQQALQGVDNKFSVMGGINPIELAGFNVKETIDVCKRLIKECEGNSRAIIAASGTVNQVPYENILAILKTVDDNST